jgi:hypothetical protein
MTCTGLAGNAWARQTIGASSNANSQVLIGFLSANVYFTMRLALLLLLLTGCAAAPIFPEGAKWQEVSRAGLVTSEGVVADRDGFVYVSDITRPDEVKDSNPGGTIWRYDPRTRQTVKFMEPSGMANGLHVDRNGDLLIAQESEMNGGRADLSRRCEMGRSVARRPRHLRRRGGRSRRLRLHLRHHAPR